ncbi:MAG: transglutaminase family protein [Actinomycetales bacterium]|nr:transglutaminase family protein [Actinomycetales bacterium]
MSRYLVKHKTGFRYSEPVVASYNEVRMLPVRDNSQVVFSSQLEINPKPASHEYSDYFGTRVVMFEILEEHSELEIVSTNLVELRAVPQADRSLGWAQLAAAIERSLELKDAATQGTRTQIPADLTKAAKRLAEAAASPAEAATAICRFIYSSMKYQFGVTGVQSNASEAWQKKIGVCQDFTHLAIGALRSVGIPARYVSGYLHPQLEPRIGQPVEGESHAWVEWYAGEWVPNDPTNNLEFPDRHIVVARGRDYDDVPPLRGVYAGGANSELFVKVEITREA